MCAVDRWVERRKTTLSGETTLANTQEEWWAACPTVQEAATFGWVVRPSCQEPQNQTGASCFLVLYHLGGSLMHTCLKSCLIYLNLDAMPPELGVLVNSRCEDKFNGALQAFKGHSVHYFLDGGLGRKVILNLRLSAPQLARLCNADGTYPVG